MKVGKFFMGRFKNFLKMQGAGNDFIMIDNRDRSLRAPARMARQLCPRRMSVGADGLILIEKSRKADFRMRIINADGSEAEMCGNGARCAVRYAKDLGIFQKGLVTFETISGMFSGKITRKGVRIYMAEPCELVSSFILKTSVGKNTAHFLNTGVPHTVIFVKNIEKTNILKTGREIRFHPRFKPAGTNVNFVEQIARQKIRLATYERGVEGETLACGTGSVAAACLAHLILGVRRPVEVITKSGESLYIGFDFLPDESRFANVTMEGPTRLVYHGNLCK